MNDRGSNGARRFEINIYGYDDDDDDGCSEEIPFLKC